LLIENSGHLLTKNELMKRLWPEPTLALFYTLRRSVGIQRPPER